ncbi:MAG: hypothetical protein JKX98_08405, partial [Alcanivoracaceae bacterium]|nr:hypothetical protein [Alcanivoracaceae bacterium]
FGEEPQEEHKEQFNIEEITKIANNLLLNDVKTKELAIQSIRVINIINITNEREPIGINLLEEHGHEFPDSPTPDDFEQIIINYEIANGIEPNPNSSSYSNLVDNEINNLRNENPWYLWPFRIIFWVVIIYGVYWFFS